MEQALTSFPFRGGRRAAEARLAAIDPARYAADFARAGASLITFHLEAVPDTAEEVIAAIRAAGCQVGISIRPGTPVEEALALLGPPNTKQAIAGGQMMVWYFDTPAHVNPTFIVYTEGEFVSSYRLDRR